MLRLFLFCRISEITFAICNSQPISLMNIITLPCDLNLDSSKSIHFFDYRNTQEIERQQIVLNQHVFSFLLEGNKEVVFDQAIQSIDATHFLLMKAGHCLMTERLSKGDHYRSVLLFFSNEAIQRFVQKVELDSLQPYDNQVVYSFQYDEFLQRFVCSLLDITQLSSEIQSKMLEVKFAEIMWYLMEQYGKGILNALLSAHDKSTQKFIRAIESNKHRKLTIKELAFLCNMSVSTFKRSFEKHYGDSPIKWFQNKRLEYAHYLLGVEKKTATEIYAAVGYESLSSFIQAYKAKYGQTPKQHHKD